MNDGIPKYAELPVLQEAAVHHAWDVFGRSDELGTLNFLNDSLILDAAHKLTYGRVINLNLPLNLPNPSLSSSRDPYRHHLYQTRTGMDDSLDSFYLQGSTQWDGLRHVRYRKLGYYGGRTQEDITGTTLGIQNMAERGFVGRGVLVDVAGYREHIGSQISPTERIPIEPREMQETLEWEGVSLQTGDVLLIRTGWLGWYLSLSSSQRSDMSGHLDELLHCPGLEAGPETAGWLWDNRVAAVAADNPALEVLPVGRNIGFLHRLLIPLLGLPIGELFVLEPLAAECAKLGQYTFLFTSAPLNLPGGVGSPANAYAIL